MSAEIFSPVTLPCSRRTMNNRLTKVALYEHMAKMYGGPPNKYHIALYTEWAKYDWGMIIAGNVQVSGDHLSLARDIVVPKVLNEETLAPFKELARTIHGEDLHEPSTRPLAIMQLVHTGGQSPNFLGGRKLGVPPMAPSPIRVGSSRRAQSRDGVTSLAVQATPHPFLRVLFQRPREMSHQDIKQAQQAFIRGASTALDAGFDGIEIHCAHGYLFAQFLDPKTNVRQDEYSVESGNALRMLHETIKGIRGVVPKAFVVGVKINSADYVASKEMPSDDRVSNETLRILDHVRAIALWEMVDFIEISGGDYESPEFLSPKASSPRQAFFAQFAKKARECLKTTIPSGINVPLILLTGGLRSPAHLQNALDAGHTDLLGIGRGSILRPDIPVILRQRILKATTSSASIALDEEPFASAPDGDIRLPFWVPRIPLVGVGVAVAWYGVRMRRIAVSRLQGRVDGAAFLAPIQTSSMTGLVVVLQQWLWLEWHEIFIGVLSGCCVGVLAYYMARMILV